MSKSFSRNLYKSLKNLEKQIIEEYPITYLKQKDFDSGTYLISNPGHYVLYEDITFNPNPHADYMPLPNTIYQNMPGFVLGFFAAIAIYSENVYLNLNGKTLRASEIFILQQRFFSLIELANSPFIFGQGPGAFSSSTSFQSSKNVIIRNGTLSRNSHHCIHGNSTFNLLLENLTCRDFEFIGIALNGSENIILHKVEIKNNRTDIAVDANYSAGRFARLFSQRLLSMNVLNITQKENLQQRVRALEKDLDKTRDEILRTGRTTTYFNNPSGIADGNVYGLVIKNKGVAINELESEPKDITRNICLRRVRIENLKCNVPEIIALSDINKKGAQLDVSGSVFQIYNYTENGKYKGNSLSELQLYLAELSLTLKIPLGKTNITMDVIEWARSSSDISELLNKGYVYKRSADSMFHVNKGIIAYRFDAIHNLTLDKCSFYNIENIGHIGLKNNTINDYHKNNNQNVENSNGEENNKKQEIITIAHDLCIRLEYPGANSYGISLSSCENVNIEKLRGEKIKSENGNAIGVQTFFKCKDINFDLIKIKNIKAGKLKNSKWRGTDFFKRTVKYSEAEQPRAIGMILEKSSINTLKDVCISDLYSCALPIKILYSP